MYLAYKGLANCYRNKHDTVFFMAYLSYLLIGIGSFLFHSTLKCRFFSGLFKFLTVHCGRRFM